MTSNFPNEKREKLTSEIVKRKLEALVMSEIAEFPELNIRRSLGEGPGLSPRALLFGVARYEIRVGIKKKHFWNWGRDAFWLESHSFCADPEIYGSDYVGRGSVSVLDARYLELGEEIGKKCKELTGIPYDILDYFTPDR